MEDKKGLALIEALLLAAVIIIVTVLFDIVYKTYFIK